MKLLNANTGRWLAGIGIGVVISETFREGWGALALLILGALGKWFWYKFVGLVLDEEVSDIKKRLGPKDPVKRLIWAHTKAGHVGKFRDCREPMCFI